MVGYPGYPQYQTYTSSARAINNGGEIVGWSSPDGSSLFATKWVVGGGGTVIPAPNSSKVRPFGISDSGAVLGTVETNSGYDVDLFPATRLGTAGGSDAAYEHYRINSSGVIINLQRQIWAQGGAAGSQNVNALLAPETATTIDDINAITNANEILGDAHDETGDAYLVVLHLATANSPTQLYKIADSDPRIDWMLPVGMNDNGLITATAFFNDGTNHAVLLTPAELMVDGNRDNEMSFTDLAAHKADQTSEEKPYRFWVNNDSDGILDGEEVEGGSRDYADTYLKSLRDLEDFSRLWISFKGFTEMVESGGVTVQLEWKPMDGGTNWPGDAGNPAINIFKAVETDGGNRYLSDEATAKSQVSYGNAPGEYSISLGRVGRGQPLTLPARFFSTLSESQPNKFLLFEGAGEGKGQLVLTLNKNGQKIGEYSPLHLDLKDVRRMYERGKITLDAADIPDPWDNDNPPPLEWVWDPWNWPPDIDPNAEQKTIAYVHGWRMTYGEYLLWADTTFKRLWHLGYKGRFYSFRWPTYHGDNNGPNPVDIFIPGGTTYNPSEYRAWLSGAALANFVNGLPNANARYLIAHSMGNVAAGSALRNNMQVKRYAMCNSAMAAMAYDGSLQPDDPSYETPDTDTDSSIRQTFGLADKFNPVGTEIVNFSLPQDYALGKWNANNAFFKPQGIDLPSGKFYQYSSGAPAGSKLMLGERGGEPNRDLRPVTSVSEAMGYVTKSRTRAAGVRQDTGGSVISFVDMGAGAGGFQFGDEHSAEWVYPIRATYPFWKEILTKFDIEVTNR